MPPMKIGGIVFFMDKDIASLLNPRYDYRVK